jgi:hypothetical protein
MIFTLLIFTTIVFMKYIFVQLACTKFYPIHITSVQVTCKIAFPLQVNMAFTAALFVELHADIVCRSPVLRFSHTGEEM